MIEKLAEWFEESRNEAKIILENSKNRLLKKTSFTSAKSDKNIGVSAPGSTPAIIRNEAISAVCSLIRIRYPVIGANATAHV